MRWINKRPRQGEAWLLAIIPFVISIAIYGVASALRLAENPNDKLLPNLASFFDAIIRYALVEDKRTGEVIFWVDTGSSLMRMAAAIAIATATSLILGLMTGMLPYLRAILNPYIAVISMVPPLALLPILFILLGLGETAKIALIVIGITPFLVRDLSTRVVEIPAQQLIKAQTLGGNSWQIALRVVLPQILPRLIDGVRLSLGPAWLFLIAAEAIAAESGLGYRIFLVRRYLAMDVIIPYVIWITFLAFVSDYLLRQLQLKAFPWFERARTGQ